MFAFQLKPRDFRFGWSSRVSGHPVTHCMQSLPHTHSVKRSSKRIDFVEEHHLEPAKLVVDGETWDRIKVAHLPVLQVQGFYSQWKRVTQHISYHDVICRLCFLRCRMIYELVTSSAWFLWKLAVYLMWCDWFQPKSPWYRWLYCQGAAWDKRLVHCNRHGFLQRKRYNHGTCRFIIRSGTGYIVALRVPWRVKEPLVSSCVSHLLV